MINEKSSISCDLILKQPLIFPPEFTAGTILLMYELPVATTDEHLDRLRELERMVTGKGRTGDRCDEKMKGVSTYGN